VRLGGTEKAFAVNFWTTRFIAIIIYATGKCFPDKKLNNNNLAFGALFFLANVNLAPAQSHI
jgi:hypothetical protein